MTDRSIEVDGVTLWACEDQGAFYSDRCDHTAGRHGGSVETFIVPMMEDGTPETYNGVTELSVITDPY